ncbi:GNAT family N-acetyltransferase [Limimaricola hongkongensis]|uniref:GNAT family N-acetyltransferase n=1 Tax=Limimaricola hongkongensis TaxID=278132 RepID=UPI000476A942|nr:GNAT family N-acetyltransferase [Limimaricola hongkongensis]
MTDWTIRRAVPEDTAALTACFARGYAQYADLPDLPPVTRGIGDDIANHYVWLAESGAGILGGAVLVIGPGRARLSNIAVDPDAAGRGIGRALLALVEEEASAWGAQTITLTTHAAMEGTHRFYDRLGWRETGRSGNRVFLEKPLPQ